MGRFTIRIVLSALFGAVLGGLLWMNEQVRPESLRMFGAAPFAHFLVGGALAGGFLTAVLDLLGLDLPFFAAFRRPDLDEYAGADLGTLPSARTGIPGAAAPPHPRLPGGMLGRALEGTGGPFIAPERAARLQKRLHGISMRLGLLLAGQMLLLVGLLAKVVFTASLGFFGDPADADILIWLSLVPYAALLVIGGWAWRVLALGFAAATLWALFGLG